MRERTWRYRTYRRELECSWRTCSRAAAATHYVWRPHTAVHVSAYCPICVLSRIRELACSSRTCSRSILLYMCPHTALYVCSLAFANWHALRARARAAASAYCSICVRSLRRELARSSRTCSRSCVRILHVYVRILLHT
jgi:hypothetical protein